MNKNSDILTIRIAPDLRAAITAAAAARGMPRAVWLRDAARTICQLQRVLPFEADTTSGG